MGDPLRLPTGLGLLELATLRAVESVAAGRPGHQRTVAVLDRLEGTAGVGARYAYPVLADLGAPWRVHLRLLDLEGNWGSDGDDPPADPRYTRLRLSPLGRLALAADRGDVGPVPFGLVEGSLYQGGEAPPFAPAAVVAALLRLVDDTAAPPREVRRLLGPPALPAGGSVEGALGGLWAGRRTSVALAFGLARESDPVPALVITGLPPGVSRDRVVRHLEMRSRASDRLSLDDYPQPRAIVAQVRDETGAGTGTRVVVEALPEQSLDEVEVWARTVWPTVQQVHLRLPLPVDDLLGAWADACRPDPSGLHGLLQLL